MYFEMILNTSLKCESSEAYLKPSQISAMELCYENS